MKSETGALDRACGSLIGRSSRKMLERIILSLEGSMWLQWSSLTNSQERIIRFMVLRGLANDYH